MSKKLLFRLAVLVAAMMCALGAAAAEAYACYTSSNTTLTFYYDNYRSSRSGTTYDLNTGSNNPGWHTDGTNASVTKVVFDASFANARPTKTAYWFGSMETLSLIEGIRYLNTVEVTDMSYMFNACHNLTSVDVSGFNTSKVTTMAGMFAGCMLLRNLDVSGFNTSKVTSMTGMFYNCPALTSLDLSSFNTSKVTSMLWMFKDCSELTTIYAGSGWSTAAVTISSMMFSGCTRLVGGQGTTYDANHVDKAYAHVDGGPSNPGYFTAKPEAYACYTPSNTTLTFYYDDLYSSRTGTIYDLNIEFGVPGWYIDLYDQSIGSLPMTRVVFDPSFADARPTTTLYWFGGMKNLTAINSIEYLNTSAVTTMNGMFAYCQRMATLDVSHFNTSYVTDMFGMFFGCNALTGLDVSNFNTSRVTDMSLMFTFCDALTTIYVGSGWTTDAVTSSSDMFLGCTSLVGGKGTTYDANHIDKAYAHIDGGPSRPGYFTEKAAGLRGDVNGDGSVNISDVTALIDYLLSGYASSINLASADCNQDSSVNISDVTALIDYLLSGTWN